MSTKRSPFRRVHAGLIELNNLLLIPVFSLIVVDVMAAGLNMPVAEIEGLEDLNLAVCVFFLAEWALGLWLTADRIAYLKSPVRIADLLSSIPFGWIHGVRAIRLLRVLRLLRVVWRMRRLRDQAQQVVRVTGLVTATAMSGAVALRMVEPHTVGSFEEAMWWSIVTMSTVGYGDISPSTSIGRAVAATMIIVGIAIFGYAVSILTSIVVTEEEDPATEKILATLNRIESRLDALEGSVDTRSAARPPSG